MSGHGLFQEHEITLNLSKRSEFPLEIEEEGNAFGVEKVVVGLEIGVVDGDEGN